MDSINLKKKRKKKRGEDKQGKVNHVINIYEQPLGMILALSGKAEDNANPATLQFHAWQYTPTKGSPSAYGGTHPALFLSHQAFNKPTKNKNRRQPEVPG